MYLWQNKKINKLQKKVLLTTITEIWNSVTVSLVVLIK